MELVNCFRLIRRGDGANADAVDSVIGQAMAWFEKERAWGVPPQELRHLCGRIGELYAAMITNGQMANNINQKGYDVVSGIGESISVKQQ